MQNLKLKIYSVIFYKKYIKDQFSYRFKLRPPHNIGGGTYFSGGTNPDNGGTIVPPLKLLKYALIDGHNLIMIWIYLSMKFIQIGLAAQIRS